MRRLGESKTHQAGGGDCAIEPGQLHHFEDGLDALSFLADALAESRVEFDFRGSVGAIAELVFQPTEENGVLCAVRPEARNEERRQSARRLRKDQESIAHRR
jgi:hypothetical protein